jgi:hypothetical protein
LATCYTDGFTGNTPNNGYGYGKPNAYELLVQNQFTAAIVGEDSVCTSSDLSISGSNLTNAYWNNGFEGLQQNVMEGTYNALVYNEVGCKEFTDTFQVALYEVQPMLPIFQSGNYLVTLSLTDYQWTKDGSDIPGANDATLALYPPFGTYTCYSVSSQGCISETPPFTPLLGMEEPIVGAIQIFPNPTEHVFQLNSSVDIVSVLLLDLYGNSVSISANHLGLYDLSKHAKGSYILQIITSDALYVRKIMKY